MATLSRMMKKAATSSAIPLANRTPHKNYTFAILSTPLKTSTTTSGTSGSTINLCGKIFRPTSIPTHRHFSDLAKEKKRRSDSDDTLVGAIESEIRRAKEVLKKPIDFPFRIEDNSAEEFITLTREYQGEEIKVTVKEPRYSSDYSDEVQEEVEYVHLDVSVLTNYGPTLEFHVMAEADGITIDSLEVKTPYYFISNEEPNFWDLNLKLQKAFEKYLEVRGLEPSNTKFLNDYMVKKYNTKYTPWFNHMKNIIAPRKFD